MSKLKAIHKTKCARHIAEATMISNLNMGYHMIQLAPFAQRLCIIITPLGKLSYWRIHISIMN